MIISLLYVCDIIKRVIHPWLNENPEKYLLQFWNTIIV